MEPTGNGVPAIVLPDRCEPVEEAGQMAQEVAAAIPVAAEPLDVAGNCAGSDEVEIIDAKFFVYESHESREAASNLRAVPGPINAWGDSM
jgi:hypothetical protein